jgi:hypothetical protein
VYNQQGLLVSRLTPAILVLPVLWALATPGHTSAQATYRSVPAQLADGTANPSAEPSPAKAASPAAARTRDALSVLAFTLGGGAFGFGVGATTGVIIGLVKADGACGPQSKECAPFILYAAAYGAQGGGIGVVAGLVAGLLVGLASVTSVPSPAQVSLVPTREGFETRLRLHF